MSNIPGIRVEISVVVGSAKLPIKQLLKMGRGAIVPLDAKPNDPVDIFANDELIARGQILVSDDNDRIKIKVIERLARKVAPATAG